MAEEMYRANPTAQTIANYARQVEETATFMADFASPVSVRNGSTVAKQYNLIGATSMQECMTKDISYNHPFELAYWYYGLSVAQQWRERQGLPRHAEWDEIINGLATLPMTADGIYTAGLPKGNTDALPRFDPFDAVGATTAGSGSPASTNGTVGSGSPVSTETFMEKTRNDHPAVLGAFGILPASRLCSDTVAARKTLDWVMRNWNWQTTWGWDYGMVAMAAARLGHPDLALEALLTDTQKNTYLPNGHNFQTGDRLRIYLPGNGALLTAIAMMCAGWDGCQQPCNPGFPQDGTWNVRWEGLQRMQ
jgi:hypothetical protein